MNAASMCANDQDLATVVAEVVEESKDVVPSLINTTKMPRHKPLVTRAMS